MSVDRLWVGNDPIDVADVCEGLADDALGGVSVFLGRVRSPNACQEVHYLDYEGYDEMILAEMSTIADELRSQFGELRVAMLHRLGRLKPGEVSLAVAVASPHRAAALSACAACVEAVKERLPVWKLEVGEAGSHYVAGSSVAGEVL